MVSRDPLIRFESVSKRFCRSLRRSMWYGLVDLGRELLGSPPRGDLRLRKAEFLALDDVSFDLCRGEALALIGPNGAGKSTVLKLLTGLMKPDSGRITVRGEVGALIELGAGFNPVLTGRENIFVAGAVLGMTRREIARRFDDIVEFAELEEFIDSPLQSYSSGMKVRLGFSVAAHLEPDVLLIDEVLAVGDVGFRAKCYNRIHELATQTAIVFVSHSMQHVSRLCNRALVLERGRVRSLTPNLPGAIRSYLDIFQVQGRVVEKEGCTIHRMTIGSASSGLDAVVEYGCPATLVVEASLPADTRVDLSWSIVDTSLALVSQMDSAYNGIAITWREERQVVSTTVPTLLLNPGKYYLTLVIRRVADGAMLCWHYATVPFRVTGDFFGAAPVQLTGRWDVGREAAGDE